MRINTNVASLNSNRVLQLTNTAVSRTLGRLSSGYRINRAADDAAGLGIANKLRADIRSLRQAARNAEQAVAVLQIAEGATQSIQSIVERMKELATQAASDNTDTNGRARIDAEYQELLDEVDRIVATTKFQGQALLNGSFTGNFMVSSSGAYTPGANSDFVQISGLDLSTLATDISTAAADLNTAANAQAALTAIDTALGTVATALGDIGAAQNRIEHAFNNTNIAIENYAAAESTIRDADFAAEMAELTRLQILQQSGIAMLAQANAAPQSILSLLR